MKKKIFALFGLLAVAGGLFISSFSQVEDAQAALCGFDDENVCCVKDGTACYCLPDNNLRFE